MASSWNSSPNKGRHNKGSTETNKCNTSCSSSQNKCKVLVGSKYRVRFSYEEKEEVHFKRKEHEKIFDGDEWDISQKTNK